MYPMDRAEEGDDDGSITQLDGLQQVKKPLSGVVVYKDGIVECVSGGKLLAKIPGQEDGGERGSHVGNRTSETQSIGLARDLCQAESVFDDVLRKGSGAVSFQRQLAHCDSQYRASAQRSLKFLPRCQGLS